MLGFHDWMLKIGSIHYANDRHMAIAFRGVRPISERRKQVEKLSIMK
jgi:hypothetical protein